MPIIHQGDKFLDFSWVKQLADSSNQMEMARQERDRREKEDTKAVSLATNPFVEKLHLVITGATEEFNRHCMFPHLRVSTGKLYKHSRTGEASTAEPDEVSYFAFVRCGYLYGIRGMNGAVEFLQMPVEDGTALNLKLHEIGLTPSRRMVAQLEAETKKIRWIMDGQAMDGPAIVSLCQKFFVDLIERTNNIEPEREQHHSNH